MTHKPLLPLVLLTLMAFGCGNTNKGPQQASSSSSVVPPKPTAVPRKTIQPSPALKRFATMRAQLAKKLPFTEATKEKLMCWLPGPAPDINVHRSLFVHDRDTIDAGDFSLKRTLDQLAQQAVAAGAANATGTDLFRELWDTQNPDPGLGLGAHCDDNGGMVNGYPVSCRPEGSEANGTDSEVNAKIDNYQPIALVNRLDLAHEKWRNCGEHRIVYAKNSSGPTDRNFIIFEAVLPNPKPGCRSGCRPVATFWQQLSEPAMDDPLDRAKALQEFFYEGLPGFRPVVHINHYSSKGVSSGYGSSGSGQIRTNQFMNPPGFLWMLKEFVTEIDCSQSPCEVDVVPVSVKLNPFGKLWSQSPGAQFLARANDFKTDFLTQLTALGAGDINGFSYEVKPVSNAAESPVNATNNYRTEMGSGTPFANDIQNNAPNGLTAEQMANRATALSCAGCHQPSAFGLTQNNAIGTVTLPDNTTTTSWPLSLSFVHTSESITTLSPPQGLAGQGHALSPALLNVFLPAREAFLKQQLSAIVCPCTSKVRFPGFHKQLIEKFQPRIKKQQLQLDKLLKALKQAKPNEAKKLSQQIVKTRTSMRRLELERDKQLAAEAKKQDFKWHRPVPAKQVQAQRFEQLKDGDKKMRNARRAELIRKQLASQPPRRTVTGSFRVH